MPRIDKEYIRFNSARLVWLLYKLPVIKKLVKVHSSAFEIQLHQWIEKASDDKINEAIKDIKEGDWSHEPFASVKTVCDDAGLTFEIILQWLEDEKFLREHRRKYQQETG